MAVRILLVSQMYPSEAEPDFGVFVADLERELVALGHEVERAVLDSRSGGPLRHLRLAWRTRRASRRFRPEVVYAHFLVPTGLWAVLLGGAPAVVTAHGQDVANVGRVPGIRPLTRLVARRAHAVVAVSNYLRGLLEQRVPEARGKLEVIDCGVDLGRFRELPRAVGPRPAFLCVGSLTERKNVVRLARAFERLGEGTLTFVGDGPLRPQLEGRPGVTLTGPVPHARVPELLAAADVVCQPSLVEPFGQALLEALAVGRSVVATQVGGPPEFVPPGAGVLVDPADEDALVEALRAAAALPTPNPAARAAAEAHDVSAQARRVEALLLGAAARDPRA
ncbi:MAG TPA: glycosyltransferase [Gaiellaceae bacterium]|nr:glycosyltransferase [Gaiellaceae bacterium]